MAMHLIKSLYYMQKHFEKYFDIFAFVVIIFYFQHKFVFCHSVFLLMIIFPNGSKIMSLMIKFLIKAINRVDYTGI